MVGAYAPTTLTARFAGMRTVCLRATWRSTSSQIGGLIFSTVLSLVFVPAMFMVMDDLGWLIWRFGKRFVVSSEDADHGDHQSGHGPPPAIRPAAE